MRNETVVCRLCLWLLTVSFVGVQGADYYVSTQGNDSNPGTATQPLRTITRAYSLASAGTTIIVMPGVYTDYTSNWGLRLGKSGTASSPIVLRSQVRGGAVIDGQNGTDRNKAIYLDGSYNVVEGFVIRRGPKGGISIWGSYNQIRNNEIHNNGNPASSSVYGQDGIYSDRSTRNNNYVANLIRDNGRAGSNLDHALYLCGDNELVLNNVMIRNAAYGLHIAGYSTVSNLKAYNNVIAYNGKSGIILWMAVSGVDIKNNIVYQNGRYGFDSWDAHGSGVVLDRNLVFGNGLGNYNFVNGGSDYTYTLGTTVSSAPLFVNSTSAAFDAHLSAGSPAINAGLNLSSLFTTDMDGVTRQSSGAWDLGAYRYGAADTTPPSVSLTAPADGATLSGLSVAVSASASDNVGVVGVQFKLNGANLGAEDTSAPYGVSLDTLKLVNGSHTLGAVARDAAGNQGAAATISVNVNNVVITPPTITLTAPASGTSYTAPATINLAASVTANGNTITKVQFYRGTTLLGEDLTAPYTYSWNNVAAGSYSLSARAVYGVGSTVSSSSVSVSVTTAPTSSDLTLASTSGTISAPFVIDNGLVYQPSYTATPAAGGRAAYTFTIPAAGYYVVSALVDAPNDGANSFFVNIDAEPTDPMMIWDIPLTSGLAGRTVSWRGNGTVDSNEFAPKAFMLAQGTHQLIVRGREGNCRLGAITIAPAGAMTPSAELTFPSTSGAITAPFAATSGTISQPAYTSLSAGGRAVYSFMISSAGDYLVSAQVDAPNDGANSFFVNIDAEPTDPATIWDIPLTSGLTKRAVSWRGTGTFDKNQYAPKVFKLSAGTHQLIVRGREGNCRLGAISITPGSSLSLAAVNVPFEPRLRISVLDGQAQVSWPSGTGGYLLQSRRDLSGTSPWTDVTQVPAVVGDEHVVTLPVFPNGELFRLRTE